MQLGPNDIRLLIDALATAASRHESQARVLKFGRPHDEKAAAMRTLRLRLMQQRQKIIKGEI